MRRRIVAVTLLLLLLAAADARAAWPGEDGRIHFWGATDAFSILPDGSGFRAETNDEAFALGADLAELHRNVSTNSIRWRPADVPVFTQVLPRSGVGLPFPSTADPRFLRDGRVIAAVTYGSGQFGIAAVPRDPAAPFADLARLEHSAPPPGLGAFPRSFAASPTRDEAFFSRWPFGSDMYTCGESIDAIDTVTGAVRTVTPATPPVPPGSPRPPCPEDVLGDVSPDGERVAFTRQVNDEREAHLMTIARTGGAPTSLRFSPAPEEGSRAVWFEGALWSPSGDYVVSVRHEIESHSGFEKQEIFRVDADGGAPVLLASSETNPEVKFAMLRFWEHGNVAAPRFTSVPSGLTRATNATVSFVAPDGAGAGRFECRYDDEPVFACTSPVQLPGQSDGEHTFEIRFIPTGETTGPVATASWTIDTTPPKTRLISGPSGTGNGPSADVAFDSADPDVERFECSLDGGPSQTCASPHPLRGLAPGQHRLAVAAIDRAGNVEPVPAELAWEVAGAAPPQSVNCAIAVASAGVVSGVAREQAGCWQEEEIQGRKAFVSTGVVSVNGIQVDPDPGTRIIVAPELSGGSFRTTGPVTLGLGAVLWPVEAPIAWNSLRGAQVAQVPKMFELLQQEMAGLKLLTVPSLELSADNGGQAKIGLKLTLPKAFKAAPGSPPAGAPANATALTIEPSVTASNDRGVTFAGRVGVAEAWLFGRAKVKDLSLAGDTATNTFEGTVGIELAQSQRLSSRAVSKDALITFAVTLAPEDLTRRGTSPLGALRKLSAQVSRFEKHLGEGFFLQRFGGEIAAGTEAGGNLPTVLISGNVGLSFGPRLQYDGIFEGELLSIDGKGTLTIPTSDRSTAPIAFDATGDGKLVDIPVTNIALRIDTSPKVTFSARQQIDVGGFGVSYGISDGFFDPLALRYSARGSGQLRLPVVGTIDGEVVQSSNGIAACAQLGSGPRVGFGKRWTDPASPFELFGSSCDIGPFSSAQASASQAGAARPVVVARGTRALVLEVSGRGSAPRVTLRAPGGEALTSPLQRNGTLLAEDPGSARTFVLVDRPAAGRWSVEGDGITAVRRAAALPAPRVRARVRRGKLRWTLKRIPGQQVTLMERGPRTARTILTTTRARGSIRFKPAASRDRKRRIEALVVQHGLPRTTLVAGRFTAQPIGPASAVRKLRRKGKRTIAWRGKAAAWAVAVRYRDGDVVTRTVTKRRLKLRRAGKVTVTVVGLGVDGVPGKAALARLKL